MSASTNQAPIRVQGADGKQYAPLEAHDKELVVLVFLQIDCPISNQYAPTLRQLCRTYRNQTRFYLVYSDAEHTAQAIQEHCRAYSLEGIPLLDPNHHLARNTGATVTPEAVVLDHKGHRVYRGRIDDRYPDFGKKRRQPTRHDLRLAIDATLKGQPVAVPETQAVGCYIDQRPAVP